jgi:hypothetical protein
MQKAERAACRTHHKPLNLGCKATVTTIATNDSTACELAAVNDYIFIVIFC